MAQQQNYLLYRAIGENPAKLQKVLASWNGFADSAEQISKKQHAIIKLQQLGYLQASVGDPMLSGDTLIFNFKPGEIWKWASIRNGNIPNELLTDASLRLHKLESHPINSEEYANMALKLIDLLSDKGYPFATIWLDSFVAESGQLSAVIFLDKGPLMTYDQIAITGNAQIQPWYIQTYLGMKQGKTYRERNVNQMQARLNQLPFIQLKKAPGIYFHPGLAVPVISIDHRKSSSFDGIVGIAPNSNANDGSILFTGEANVKLQNMFKSGKSMDLYYRSFLGNSQDLKFKFGFPYLFKSPIGLDYELNLLRQDSTFLYVKNEVGMSYRFFGTDQIKFTISNETTSLLSVDTISVRTRQALPESGDMTLISYGVAIKLTRLDYLINPTQGYNIEVGFAAGDKTIVKNTTIASMTFQEGTNSYNLYDRLSLQTLQYKGTLNAERFFLFGKATVLRLHLNAGTVQSPRLFLNDLFRIGGLRTLKGFDEQSIFASTYLIMNTELRYLTGKNSNVMVFWNGATYENRMGSKVVQDQPYGFGAGANLETAAGVFSIFYAQGKAFNNPIEFNKGKVHFGLVNYF